MALRYIGTIAGVSGHEGSVTMSDVTPRFTGLPSGTPVAVGYTEDFARFYSVELCEERGGGRFLLKFAQTRTPEEASLLLEMGVFVEEDIARANVEGGYFEDDIVGCSVVNAETKEFLGTVKDVWYMPASDVWVVDYRGGDLPVPAVETFVRRVDVAQKTIEIFVMEGLLDLASGDTGPDADE